MNSGITAQLATIPGRESLVVETVLSLLDQVDKVRVALNNYTRIPDWLSVLNRVEPFLRKNQKGDFEKFYKIPKGYILSCDDDLIYPENYAHVMVKKLQHYRHRAVISAHGRQYGKKPVKSYYYDRTHAYRCLEYVNKDREIQGTIGTGVMCFHTDYFNVDYYRVKAKNMADIWIAKFAKEQGLPLIVVEHQEGWLKYQHPESKGSPTIWDMEHNNDKVQTDLFNSF